MIIVFELLLLALAILSVLALLYRVRCPPDHALVLTDRSSEGSLRAGPPAYRVLADRGVFRLPSVGSVDVLDLSPARFDAFVPLLDDRGERRGEVHAVAQVRVSRRTVHLRRAAVRVMGMPRRDLDAIGEGALAVAVRDALGGRSAEHVEQDREEVGADVRDALGPVLDELGMEIIDVQVRLKKRDV